MDRDLISIGEPLGGALAVAFLKTFASSASFTALRRYVSKKSRLRRFASTNPDYVLSLVT